MAQGKQEMTALEALAYLEQRLHTLLPDTHKKTAIIEKAIAQQAKRLAKTRMKLEQQTQKTEQALALLHTKDAENLSLSDKKKRTALEALQGTQATEWESLTQSEQDLTQDKQALSGFLSRLTAYELALQAFDPAVKQTVDYDHGASPALNETDIQMTVTDAVPPTLAQRTTEATDVTDPTGLTDPTKHYPTADPVAHWEDEETIGYTELACEPA